jgi:hypothetical protein
MKRYNSTEPPEIIIENIKGIPIVIIGGTMDEIVNTIDLKLAVDKLKESVVYYQEYPLGHGSYQMAKNMSFFTQDVMEYILKYQPLSKH